MKIPDNFLKFFGLRDSRRLSHTPSQYQREKRYDDHIGPPNPEKTGTHQGSKVFLHIGGDNKDINSGFNLLASSAEGPAFVYPPRSHTLSSQDLEEPTPDFPSTETSGNGPSKDISATSPSPGESKEPQEPSHQLLEQVPSSRGGIDPAVLGGLADPVAILINQQKDASSQRSHVRELRMALRDKRDEEAQLRAVFMKRLGPLFTSNGQANFKSTGHDSLSEQYNLLQRATAEYLELENTYHQAEDALREQEYMLTRSMERFLHFSQGEKSPTSQDNGSHREMVHSYIDDDASSLDSTPQDIPAGLREYLFRVGDVRIFQERLADLDAQYTSIIRKQEQRHRLHMPLDQESWEFLQTYEEEWRDIWADLSQAQLDAKDLECMCAEQGLLTGEHKNTLDYVYQFDVMNQISEIHDGGTVDHDVNSPLKLPALPEETDGQVHFFEALPADIDCNACVSGELEAPKMDKAAFVNRWIWHQLQISTIEIHRLEACYALHGVFLDNYDAYLAVGELAKAEWFRDKQPTSAKSISELDVISNDTPQVFGSDIKVLGRHRAAMESMRSLQPFLGRQDGINTVSLHGSPR
ncbi:hypothetical protein BDV59DRAFT_168998 [Aspergillus ambiguus]|uniref:uncharacterized protein n=1 Tax=Aspergillus ambiguus TaxID=176160 RepID=UPI003CCD9004